MASLTFKNLCKTYPNGFASVKDFSLEVADGSLVTLYGPHGCGKSTILRMIGGLEDITSGKIYLGDDLLNDIYPRDRKLAMAFQNYRLYGHLNVYENIALGLRLRSLPRNVIESRVRTAAEFFGITDILTRKIRTLSEIHKQCVALSRALVCKPKVLLIDEDFSHQDEKLRERMLADMIRIHREFHLTMLYVTNDYNEAILYGNLTVFMRSGQILEVRENPDF